MGMRALYAVAVACIAGALGCGPAASRGDAGAPDAGAPADAGFAADAGQPTVGFLETFSQQVAVAAEVDGGGYDCALSLPNRLAGDSAEVQSIVASEFLRVVQGQDAQAEVTPCGVPGFARCSDRFQNHLFHSNGYLGDSLKPLAQQVEQSGMNVKVIVWSAQDDAGFSIGPGVSIAGTWGGRSFGILYVAKRPGCRQ